MLALACCPQLAEEQVLVLAGVEDSAAFSRMVRRDVGYALVTFVGARDLGF